ncbi:MAG: toluene tolerance protein [Pseudomonadales bacterium]|jgi:tRNA A-37 threonylcarbamoyl transferase component Bud32|tara:strand:- start:177 stop:797 length:621 start_codon:yes stop_codon:yes gene_type:complete
MKSLDNKQYLKMRAGADVTAADEYGDKVLLLKDGTYLKLFRVKRLFTSARLFPYWRRFEKNAEALHALGVPTLKVIESIRLPEIDRTAVHYEPLPGNILREVPDFDARLVSRLGAFIKELHDKGVYLRSMHLGNVVLTPEDELGLIDIADMKVYGGALRKGLRLRNLHHLWRYEQDRRAISPYQEAFVSSFDAGYREKAARMFAPE